MVTAVELLQLRIRLAWDIRLKFPHIGGNKKVKIRFDHTEKSTRRFDRQRG